MKTSKTKPRSPAAGALARTPSGAPALLSRAARRGAAASNPALNNQNRRVLAQHYRAKYGVK